MMEKNRGTGRTTYQMTHAPEGSVFVWIAVDLSYPKRLAKDIKREDLQIVGPQWLENGWRGRELKGLVIDHAALDTLGESKRDLALQALARVR